MEKISLSKEQLLTAIRAGLQDHYDILKGYNIDDDNIDTLFHLVTGSIIDCIEDEYLKRPTKEGE